MKQLFAFSSDEMTTENSVSTKSTPDAVCRVFVVMPFAKDFDDLYLLGIKAACDVVGVSCERVDEQIFHETILDRVLRQIREADLVIGETTGRNPNVFYEIGYAHAVGKRVLLLTRSVEDIPFDLQSYPHHVHGGRIAELKASLIEKVPQHLQAPQPGREHGSILTAEIPDIRVRVQNGLLGSDLRMAMPFLDITAENHSPIKVFLSNFFLTPTRGGILLPERDDITRELQQRVEVEPGDSHSFRVGGTRFLDDIDPEEVVTVGVRDAVGRRFLASEKDTRDAIGIVYRDAKKRKEQGGDKWDHL